MNYCYFGENFWDTSLKLGRQHTLVQLKNMSHIIWLLKLNVERLTSRVTKIILRVFNIVSMCGRWVGVGSRNNFTKTVGHALSTVAILFWKQRDFEWWRTWHWPVSIVTSIFENVVITFYRLSLVASVSCNAI